MPRKQAVPFVTDVDSNITLGGHPVIEEFIAGGTLTAREVAGFDSSQTGADQEKYAVQGGANGKSVGVVLETVSADDTARILVQGYCSSIKATGSFSDGTVLEAGASGIVAPLGTTSNLRPLGVALGAASGGYVEGILYPIR